MVLLGGAGPASASGLPGPSSLSTGFGTETLLFDDGQVSVWFPRMEQLASSWVRIPVVWASIAPARPLRGFQAANPRDPHYYWVVLDGVVREAAATRQRVLLTIESPPSWALGRGAPRSAWPGTWRPNPRAYGAFAHAVAERYSGHFPDPAQAGRALPRAAAFQAWNEPNLPTSLEPQWTRTRHGFVPASPGIYRGLLNAAYANIKSAQPHAYILAAGLAPYGDPPGISRMRPVTFLRELLCLHGSALRPQRCPDPAHFDAIDIHPYGLSPTLAAFNADDVSVPDLGRLSQVLRVAGQMHRALPLAPKAIWVTEIGWTSSPPVRGAISLAQQARYLARADYELWRQGASHVFWYEAVDPPGASSHFPPVGLFFSSGQPKPATIAFRFPFVAIRVGRGVTTLWGRAPTASAPVVIEVAHGDGWHPLVRLRTTRGGVFYARRRLGSHLTLRARVGAVASYPWTT